MIAADGYAHEGCSGHFRGGQDDACDVCGAAPQGLQAWLPVRGAPPPQWYLDLRKSNDRLYDLLGKVMGEVDN